MEFKDKEVKGAQQQSVVSAPQHRGLTRDMNRGSGEQTALVVDPVGRHRASPQVRGTSLKLVRLKQKT